jgi:hypothetical protein
VEPEKIIAKPFDASSSQKINGVKPKASLLESIIRLRLDRITGNPGIYPSVENESGQETFSVGLQTASNVDADKITQVECFLIQKLKKTLYLLSQKYSLEIIEKEQAAVQEEIDTKPPPGTGGDQAPTSPEQAAANASKYESELKTLEILKAKEDAILFLLKDTSSSNSVNADVAYSSLDIQEGIIRTSSGFSDVLSGTLYSILSYRSEYLDKMIKEKRQLLDSTNSKSDSPEQGTPSGSGFAKNPGKDTYTYFGICQEDFVIYTIALLSLNQDFLIGLLPSQNRRNLANILSTSILGSKKDPYGITDRLSKESSNGGFPSVADSVNALAIIVAQLYEEYISYITIKNKKDSEKILQAAATTKNSA